jgi:glycosyltransferase involved in cell wall biosynthesis
MTGRDPATPIPLGIVIGSMNRGGTETHLLDLLPALKQYGFAPSIFLIGADGPLREVFQAHGVPVLPERLREPPPALPRVVRRLLRLLYLLPGLWAWGWRHRRGLVHAYLSEAVILSALALWPMRHRLLLAQRGLFTYRAAYGAAVTALERWAFRQSRAITANSGHLVEMLAQDGVPSDKIIMIPNGLSPERMTPIGADRAAARARLNLSDDAFVFVKVANLHVYKGHEDVLEALARLRVEGVLPPRTIMLFVGSDAFVKGMNRRSQIEQRARDLGIGDIVRCLGDRKDATFLIRAADIGVHASHEEGSSNAVIEMMAAGLPVVATDAGGTVELLAKGAAGRLVPPSAPEKLAEAIRALLKDSRMRKTLGEVARQRAQSDFTLAQCVDRYARVYNNILKQ